MRIARPISPAEHWDLGLLMAFFIVTLLVITAILKLNALPRMFASNAAPAPLPETSTIEILPQEPPATPLFAAALQQPTFVEPAVITPLVAPKARPEIKTYKGQKFQYVKTLRLRVTAYAPDPRCCWPYPGTTTASGQSVKTNGGKLVAADTSIIPMHSLVVVPGYASSDAVPVLDRGGAIKGHRMDVLLPTFSQAQNWGSKMLEVKIYRPM